MSDTGTVKSLPFMCFEAADGDPLLALLLALDFLEAHGREWRGIPETGGPDPQGHGAASPTSSTVPLASRPRAGLASGLLEDAA